MKLYNIFGWIGTFVLLFAIGLNNFGILTGKSIPFLSMMIFANSCMLYLNYSKNVFQAVIINLIMIIIAVVPLVLILWK